MDVNVFVSSESLQKDVKTPVKRRQPAMGVSAYSLKARKSQNTLAMDNNGLQRRFATNPNLKDANKFRSTHNFNQIASSHSNYIMNYDSEFEQSPYSDVTSQDLADYISISMIKHRRMHSASILCSSLRGFSTDV
jgi:hypothetical protein